MSNKDTIATILPVDALALGVWGDNTNTNYIAGKIVKPNPYLELPTGKIEIMNSKNDTIDDKPTDPLEKAPLVNETSSTVEYRTVAYRRGFVVNPKDFDTHVTKDVARLRQQMKGSKIVTRKLKNVFESIVAGKVFDTSYFTNTTPSTAWSNLSSSTPVSDIRSECSTIKKNTSMKPNTLILGQNAYAYLCGNSSLTQSIRNIDDQIVKVERLLDLIRSGDSQELRYIYIADTSVNTANVGQAESRDFIWNPNKVWVGTIQDTFDGNEMYGALALKMESYTDTMNQETPVRIRIMPVEEADENVEKIEGKIEFDLVRLSNTAGRLLTIGS